MPRVGSEFASYRIRGVLGRGGMSVVFRADNLRLGNEVALKVMSVELSEDDAFRERFVRESRLAASINHPNIIPIYDAGEEDGLLYIAMRFVEGADLKTLIRQAGPLSLRRAGDIVSQVARGLSVAHQRGLVHRDIKPANILTERAGAAGETVDHAYLTDFGLMKHQFSRSGLTNTGQFLGTVDYVAPEQVEGRQTDHRADIYSLGCVLYECLTGTVPYPRDGEVAVLFAHVQDAVPRVTDSRPDLPSAVDEIVARAMAKLPERRYANATDISQDLTQTVGASRYSHAPPLPSEIGPRGRPTDVVAGPPAASPAPPAATSAPSAPPGTVPGSDGERATPAPSMPARARQSLVVTGLAVALLVALGVIGYQLLSGGSSSSNVGSNTTGSSGPTQSTGGGPITAFTGPAKPSDLRLVMPTVLLKTCHTVPAQANAIAALSCSAPAPGVSYEVWLYRNTAQLQAAYDAVIVGQGIQRNSNGCTPGNWRGEREWKHHIGTLGGRVACYLDVNNNDPVIAWMHMSKNKKGAPPQDDHRDILGIARTHSQIVGGLVRWWKYFGGSSATNDKIIGKLQP
jgi:serine/threonine-protein kinase